MGLFKGLKNQMLSVIQWDNPGADVLFYKYTARGDEIKDSSKLIVGPGQGCILVYEGKVAAHIDKETLFNIKTDNDPFITTLFKVMQAFESEHKTGIYFYRKADVLNCRWGTPSPIKYVDPLYKFPVNLGMYGNYSFRINNALNFFTNVVAGADVYTVSRFQSVIGSRITQPITNYLANAKFGYTDIDAHRTDIAENFTVETKPVFTELGFELLDFRVEGASFDDDTLERIAKIADITAENLAAREAGLSYADMQRLQALRDAARNEGGLAGAGAQLGAGLQLGQVMGQQMNQQQPIADGIQQDDITAKLQKLKVLFDGGLIDESEYKAKKDELLKYL